MEFIEFLKVVVLGIVEGFTEWLPISSTGHMILVDEIIHLNVTDSFMSMFRVVIQLGAILAVVVLYFRKLNPFDSGKTAMQKRVTLHLWIKIAVACVPAAVFGLLVVYSLKDVSILSGSHGLPELIAVLAVVGLHLWKGQMLLSIAGGTVCYMLLVQFVF